jgi:hypothetical protein
MILVLLIEAELGILIGNGLKMIMLGEIQLILALLGNDLALQVGMYQVQMNGNKLVILYYELFVQMVWLIIR